MCTPSAKHTSWTAHIMESYIRDTTLDGTLLSVFRMTGPSSMRGNVMKRANDNPTTAASKSAHSTYLIGLF
jgi:hypothetical protein